MRTTHLGFASLACMSISAGLVYAATPPHTPAAEVERGVDPMAMVAPDASWFTRRDAPAPLEPAWVGAAPPRLLVGAAAPEAAPPEPRSVAPKPARARPDAGPSRARTSEQEAARSAAPPVPQKMSRPRPPVKPAAAFERQVSLTSMPQRPASQAPAPAPIGTGTSSFR